MSTWQITDNSLDFRVSHIIEASKAVVYAVLADMEAYPDFINDLVSVKRQGDLYHFRARAALLTIPATVKVTNIPYQSIHFALVEGPVEVLNGSWLVEDGVRPDQTQVTLTIHTETGARSQWLLRMTARFIENKSAKLIAAFASRVVELQQHDSTLQPSPADGFKPLKAQTFGQSRTPPDSPGAIPRTVLFNNEHQFQTIEALASTMLPADDFDDGIQGLGFVGVVEMRARYEQGRAELYSTALNAVDSMALTMFNKPDFLSLTASERTQLLDAVRQDKVDGNGWGTITPSAFFSALWEDALFLYCTQPDTWQRIGFSGPSHHSGGYQDFDQVQRFTGEKVVK